MNRTMRVEQVREHRNDAGDASTKYISHGHSPPRYHQDNQIPDQEARCEVSDGIHLLDHILKGIIHRLRYQQSYPHDTQYEAIADQ